MNSETEQLRNLVALWEKKMRHAEKMVARLRSALALPEDYEGTSPESSRRRSARPKAAATLFTIPTPAPFTRKYEKSAKGYIIEILSDKNEASLPEIRKMLSARGLRYTVQALAESMRSLLRAGQVRRRRAPAGAGSVYLYAIVRQNSVEARP